MEFRSILFSTEFSGGHFNGMIRNSSGSILERVQPATSHPILELFIPLRLVFPFLEELKS